MEYLIFDSESDAQFRNHEIAVSQGSGGVDDITQYWFGMIINQDGKAALEISDKSLITESERLKLKDENWMQQNGWLNNTI